MTGTGTDHLLIVGPGRLGLAIGSELLQAGWPRQVTFLGRNPHPPAHPVFSHPAVTYRTPEGGLSSSPAVAIIAVPDAAVPGAVRGLSALGVGGASVLHLSGVLSTAVLAPLREEGSAIGSMHPLVTIADPVRDAPALRGAWFGVEGEAEAVQMAREIIHALGGQAMEVAPGGKPLYHAAAVFASNYVVTLLAVAERLMEDAGVPPERGRPALTALAARATANVADSDPVRALTGPVSRGDTVTVDAHLQRLSGGDRRLYSVLAREALELASARGLAPDAVTRLAALIQAGMS